MTEQGETRATLLEIRSSAVNAKVDFQNHVRTQMSKVLQTQLAYLAATLLCMCGTEITRCVPDLDTSEFSSDLMCCACAGGIRTGDICVSIQDPEQDECWPAGSLTSTPSFERCVNFQEQFPCSDSIVAGYRDADTLGQLNSKGFSCADVRDIFNLGHSDVCSDIYDTRYFTSTEMCTICGGGTFLFVCLCVLFALILFPHS